MRIFTPSRELPFAGHPLIGTAAVLGRAVPVEGMMLETQVGNLAVALERDDMTVTGAVLEQPPPSFADHPAAAAVRAALGLDAGPVAIGDNGLRVGLVDAGSEQRLAELAPDQSALSAIEGLDVLSVYADGDPVRVRVFCPWAGIAEDPAPARRPARWASIWAGR